NITGLAIQQQEFLDADRVDDYFEYTPYDGIIGLGWPTFSVGNVIPPMRNLLPFLDAPLFTVWLERQGGAGGLVTFGAVDTTNCELAVNYVPLSSEAYGQFSISGFSIARFSKEFAQEAISDTGSSWIGIPPYLMDRVAGNTGARYDTGYQFYTVACSTMMTQPDVEFTINGVKYTLKSEDYVIDVGLGGGQCALAFFIHTSGGFGPAWVLGDPFIRTYCNIYDIGQKRIGFAKS
ncbi:hypothetical protein Angca_010229, partial [Angiostrongylus cantonensis]